MIMKYISINNVYAVTISEFSLETMLKTIETASSNETGGVLMGSYSSDLSTAVIKNVTGPPSDSKSGKTWFSRGVVGLKKLFQQLWSENIYYLGEWHFHPHGSANPSSTDITQMINISKTAKFKCPEPILLIIGGSVEEYEMRCFIFPNGKLIELFRKSYDL